MRFHIAHDSWMNQNAGIFIAREIEVDAGEAAVKTTLPRAPA